jgi:hypothetical protein
LLSKILKGGLGDDVEGVKGKKGYQRVSKGIKGYQRVSKGIKG